VLAFGSCDKIPEMINFKEERLIWVHSFGDFSPWLVNSIVLGMWQGKTSWWEYTMEQSCSPHGNWEEKKREEGVGSGS
jgi:hypothetical protein